MGKAETQMKAAILYPDANWQGEWARLLAPMSRLSSPLKADDLRLRRHVGVSR